MSFVLGNDLLSVTVETAGEKYCGSRFDWNGTVVGISYKGIPLLSAEKLCEQEDVRIHGRGLHNEFGIRNCIGYDDTPVGGWFPKIGTGWLKKDDEPYFFYKNYELDPLVFTFAQESDEKASFACVSGDRNGYSYKYTKSLELCGSSLVLSYRLDNLGIKLLCTTEYVHNFLLPGGIPVGEHLELSFPWKFDSAKLVENVNTSGVINIREDGLSFTGKPDKEFFLGGVWQSHWDYAPDMKAAWTVTDRRNNISMSETCSLPLYGCDVWGHGNVLSPELFAYIRIEPGQSLCWQRTYKFQG